MKLELAVTVHNYQRRFCWMLSSLFLQLEDCPDFCVSVAHVRNNGDPNTESVIDFFKGRGMQIKSLVYDDISGIARRGLVRNRHLTETSSEWLWFGDCDMIVDRKFLGAALSICRRPENIPHCLTTGRFSTGLDDVGPLIDRLEYPQVVPDLWDIASRWTKKGRRGVGAGYCQIANVAYLRDHLGGKYINPKRCPDRRLEEGLWDTPSDIVFRQRLPRKFVDLPWFIHLQHRRGRVEGRLLEEQR